VGDVSTVPTTRGGNLGSSFAPGNVSLAAPSSFALQAFHLDFAHRLNTLTWSDPCNSILNQGCALPSQDYTCAAPPPVSTTARRSASKAPGSSASGLPDEYPVRESRTIGGDRS
jgi:hypothetical protein